MNRDNILIGLKTDADLSSESDDFFSSDSETGELQIFQKAPVPIRIETRTGEIKSFEDVSSHLNSIFSDLKNYQVPKGFQSDLYLIPENIVPDELARAIHDFGKNTKSKSLYKFITEFDSSNFPDAILAQIDLIKFFKTGENKDLKKYQESKIDSRILSLIHYALIENQSRETSLYHTVMSLEEYVKFPTPAPLSLLFPAFSIDKIIDRLCTDLINEFPNNPFLESVLNSFSPFCSTIDKLNEMLNQMNDLSIDDDDDSFSDDSFFQNIQHQPVIQLQLHDEGNLNPLDLKKNHINRYEPVVLREPPQMVTFLLQDNTDQMSPPVFESWILSIRVDRQETIKNANQIPSTNNTQNKKSKHVFKSSPIMAPNLNQSDEGNPNEESVDYFFKLLQHIDDQQLIKQQLPSNISPSFYSLYLPVLHTLNIANETVEMRGAIYTKLLTKEKDAHFALKLDDPVRAIRALTYLKTLVPNTKFKQKEIQRLENKRAQPSLTPKNPDSFVAIMAVVDYELIIHSRSPLSLQYYTVPVQDKQDDKDKNICDPKWRAQFLFSQYTENELSPYLCFRVAFALAINLCDKRPDLACSFAFEALYVFLANIPFVRKLPCIRSALLFFGEMLERLNRYYYAAYILDNFFLTDIRNASYSSKIAQIAQRNNDMVRAIFHFNQTLKNFVAHGSVEEAIYVGQVITSCYIEHGLYELAMSLLTYLLHLSYQIPVGKKREKMEVVSLGSLRLPRSKVSKLTLTSEFMPDISSTPTILSAAMLSMIFAKLQYFDHAYKLINTIQKNASASMTKLLQYIHAYIASKENNICKMHSVSPKIESINQTLLKQQITSSHFTIMSGSNFDPISATLRLFAHTYLNRCQFRKALLYSELYLYFCSPSNIKELGCGLFLRAQALLQAYHHCLSTTTLFDADTKIDMKVSINSSKLYTKKKIAKLAVESLIYARTCFSIASCSSKLVAATLLLTDMALSISTIDLNKLASSQNKVATKKPLPIQLLTKLPSGIDIIEPKFLPEIKTIDGMLTNLEHLTNRILNPLYIIYYQLLMAQNNLSKENKKDTSKKFFDYAFNNFNRLFTCGYRLIPVDLGIKKIRYITELLEKMCGLLIEFDTDFINDRLIIFDVYNDSCCVLKNRLRNATPTNTNSIDPSIDLSPLVLDIENLQYPSFSQLLKANGFITENQIQMQQQQQMQDPVSRISQSLNFVSANVRLYNKEKLSLDDLNNRNRHLCDVIESNAEITRRLNASQLPPETSYNYLKRCKPTKVSKIVFIQRIFSNIIVYAPSTGFLRKISYPSNESHISIADGKNDFQFDIHSGLFEQQLIEQCASLIVTDSKKARKKPLIGIKSLQILQRTIFTNDLTDELGKSKINQVDDSFDFDKNGSKNKDKGVLFTLDPGDGPIIFIPSHDLQFIPFELAFNDCYCLRSSSFAQLVLQGQSNVTSRNKTPRPIVFRSKNDMQNDITIRTHDLLNDLISAASGYSSEVSISDGVERSINFPTPLFSAQKEFDPKSFSFCDFVDVKPNEFPKMQNASSSLFVFSYSDLFEMPILVRRVISEYPFSFFMFIPIFAMKDAFKKMKEIYERQAKRAEYVQKNGKASDDKNRVICENPMKFVSSMQITLQQALRVPIPLISYLH